MSGGSFKQHPPNSSGLLSFLDGTNGPPVTAPSSSSPAYGLKLSTLQMSGRPLADESSEAVTLSAWDLREISGDAQGICDDPKLGMEERLAIEKRQGLEFGKIHDGTHPDVAAYLAARPLALLAARPLALQHTALAPEHTAEAEGGLVKKMVTMFESKKQQLPPASSSSASILPSTVYCPPAAPSSPLRAASGVPATSMPGIGPDGQNRRSDRRTGPGFHEHRKNEDSRVEMLTTSEKKAKTALVLPPVEIPEEGESQATGALVGSPQEPFSAEIPPGGGVLGGPAISMLSQNDLIDSEVGPIRRSDRQTGPGFYEHRKDEDSRLDKLTSPAKKPKTAPSPLGAGPLVRSPAGGGGQKGPASPTDRPAPSSPAGEGVARYPVRQTGIGFYEFQQAENDRVNQPKKRARP